LLTESQAIAPVGWQGDEQVGAQEMTYGHADSAYPDLAGEAFIDPTRPVWIVTLYFPAPVASSWAAPSGAALPDSSSATIVIDAATGTETDWCEGCSTIPASAVAAALAAARTAGAEPESAWHAQRAVTRRDQAALGSG